MHDDVPPASDNTCELTATHDDAVDSEDEMPDLEEEDEPGYQTESDALSLPFHVTRPF